MASGSPRMDRDLVKQASDILGEPFDPTRYLLTHATLVASVDTEVVPNAKLGMVQFDGQKINRKYANYRVKPECEKWINNNDDCWDRPVLMKSYRTLIGAHSFVEHVQIEELSKGRIIDAVARDIGPSVYVDILVANDKKHEQLIQDIESGRLNSLSMGCTTEFTLCTKCGNYATDETEFCQCIRHLKGNTFFDEMGRKHRVAELCGHVDDPSPTAGVVFVEGSWVGIPAFSGAVARGPLKVVGDEAFTPSGRKVFNIPKTLPAKDLPVVQEGLAKAASTVQAQDFEDIPAEEAPAPAPEEKPDPLKALEDELYAKMLERVKKRVEDDLAGGAGQYGTTNPIQPTTMAPNETLLKEAQSVREASVSKVAQYKAEVQKIVRTASSDNDFLSRLETLNKGLGLEIPGELYKVARIIGPQADFDSLPSFLKACELTLGREPKVSEAMTLVRMAKLLSLRGKSPS